MALATTGHRSMDLAMGAPALRPATVRTVPTIRHHRQRIKAIARMGSGSTKPRRRTTTGAQGLTTAGCRARAFRRITAASNT